MRHAKPREVRSLIFAPCSDRDLQASGQNRRQTLGAKFGNRLCYSVNDEGRAMRKIIEVRVMDSAGSNAPISLAEIVRADGELKQPGLKLSEGRDLIREVQRVLVNAQSRTLLEAHSLSALPCCAVNQGHAHNSVQNGLWQGDD